ncbi:MAG: SsrA-binding protein SmpB [Firmicutes bacterium]|nr:SsrA-binding protein SmpB [Bacillota bacterium]MBQ5959101.1 SsrA-binding protein SmpB [Bacillota bacterium]
MDKEYYRLIAHNKKASHEYFFEELYEAGIELAGTEVKALRTGKCSVKESYIQIKNGQAFILNMHISPYEKGNIFNRDPVRTRRLLLHKNEIRKLVAGVSADGYTIVPVKVYFKGNYAKIQIALARGKKLYDKRESIAKKDQRRDAERDYKVKGLY